MENLKEENAKEEQVKIENVKEEKIKAWLFKKENLIAIGLFIFAFIFRLYYFIITKNQPLWWDEAEYMSAAKSYAGIVPYELSGRRLPGFSMIVSLFYRVGISNEVVLRFFILLTPSLLIILLVYLILREMYKDKRIAIISTLILTVLWENVFYSNRFQTENFALLFQFLAIYVLFRTYINKRNLAFIKPKYSLIWIAIFSIIAILFRPGNLPFVPAIFLFLVLINKSKVFSKKGIPFVIIFLILFIAALFIAPKMFPVMYQEYYHTEKSIAWNNLAVFYGFYAPVNQIPALFFYAFIIGIIIFLIDLAINFKKIKTISNDSENSEFKSDIFNFLVILCVLAFFIFILRNEALEFRWFFPLLTGMLALTNKGLTTFFSYLNMILKNKTIINILLIIFVVLGLYTQIVHADSITKLKVSSYEQVKEAGLWLKENSNPKDVIVSASVTQLTYYSERKIEDFYYNDSEKEKANDTVFNWYIPQLKPRYLAVSVFEPGFTPQWAYDWPQRHNNSLAPVMFYFLDENKQQPALIIYEFKNYDII